MKIYFAAPLFCQMELERNVTECALLEAAGHQVYLPQRDGGEAVKGIATKVLFDRDVEALKWCDVVVAYADGRVPDEGMAFEMGFAFASNKPVYVVSTDARSFENGIPNAMLLHSGTWHYSTTEVIEYLKLKEASI